MGFMGTKVVFLGKVGFWEYQVKVFARLVVLAVIMFDFRRTYTFLNTITQDNLVK